mgnify:CR=1 FL=1
MKLSLIIALIGTASAVKLDAERGDIISRLALYKN